MRSGLGFLPVRGRLAAAQRGLPFPGAAAFYSAHLPLDIGSHAAVQAPFVQLDQGDNGDGANGNSDQFGFDHRGNS